MRKCIDKQCWSCWQLLLKIPRCCCSVSQLCLTLCDPMDCSTSGLPVLTISWGWPSSCSLHPVKLSSCLLLWCPLLLLPSFFPSIRDFSSESSVCIRWSKYWSFSFSISPSSEYSELISLEIDWFDLLAVQETFRSLLQHHSSKASILWHSPSLWSSAHNHTWPLGKT